MLGKKKEVAESSF